MLHPNLKQILTVLSVALIASCQSVQAPKVEPVKPTINKQPKTIIQPKKDEGLAVINTAIELIKTDNPEKAEAILVGYLKNNNDNRAKLNLALIYMQKKQFNEAKKLFISIREIDESNPIVVEHLAIIAREQGRFKQAKELYIKALKYSDKPSIHLNYAILLDLYLNELNLALKHYTKYQSSGLAIQDNIKIDKWIADLKIRIKRAH